MKHALVALALAGCGFSNGFSEARGPDGRPGWWRVTCEGDDRYCLKKSDELCPGGYVTGSRRDFRNRDFGTVDVEMLIRCE